jgi:hypothetical protein
VPERPLGFAALDPAVQAAIDKHHGLHGRWSDASSAADDAAREVERAGLEDAEVRARRIAGGEPDPGPRSLIKLQQAAERAAQDRDVLARACDLARQEALEVAHARSAVWSQAAGKQVEEQRRELLDAIEQLDEAISRWVDAEQQLVLASNERARTRGGGGSRPIPRLALRGPSRDNYHTNDVLTALRGLTHAEDEAA